MSDKTRGMPPSTAKTLKTKRPSTVSVASTSSRGKPVPSASKDKNAFLRPKINKNATVLGEGDVTISKHEGFMPDFEEVHWQKAYENFLREMLQDCAVDEKIELEETNIDVQIAQLADRFQKTVDEFDRTSKRFKDISFVVEQKRLLDLKNQDVSQFYNMTEPSNVHKLLNNLSASEQDHLNRLEMKNIDFGYNKDSGHKQLLDAVNDAIEGLNQIKKQSKLDIDKFKAYEKSAHSMLELEKDRFDLESLKCEFDAKFPKLSEQLMKEISDQIAKMMDDDAEDDD